MQDELLDRFGDIPKSVENLLIIAYLKSVAHGLDIVEIKANKQEIKLIMFEQADVDRQKIALLLEKFSGRLKIKLGNPPYFLYTYDKKQSNY